MLNLQTFFFHRNRKTNLHLRVSKSRFQQIFLSIFFFFPQGAKAMVCTQKKALFNKKNLTKNSKFSFCHFFELFIDIASKKG